MVELDNEYRVKIIVKRHLQSLGYTVVNKGEYPLPVGEGGYRRYPDIFAERSDGKLVVECKGGSKHRRFYHIVNALGQVLALKAHYPAFIVVIAVPRNWGEDCLSKEIRETYHVDLWLVDTLLEKVITC